jgi:hypothetical protein
MRLIPHPKVYSDIQIIMAYYEEVGTPELASEFYTELPTFHGRGGCAAKVFRNSRTRSSSESSVVPLSFALSNCHHSSHPCFGITRQ